MTDTIRTAQDYEEWRARTAKSLLDATPFNRGSVHAQATPSHEMATHELSYTSFKMKVPQTMKQLQELVNPNLPWAEDHFQERISGEPLNPPPSNEWWPFNQNKNQVHKGADEKFSHTYPERFWPKYAGDLIGAYIPSSDQVINQNQGIRYRYGDLEDLIEVLINEPRTRQAYLPIWFPEDLAAAEKGERVPCTLGYHFMCDSLGRLNLAYPMRSCDFLRFMPDDIYMAGRLMQYVIGCTGELFSTGTLHMNISSLHAFVGDRYTLQQMSEVKKKEEDWDDIAGSIMG